MRPANFPQNKERKRVEAAKRQAEWATLSPKEQLLRLDRAPGQSKRQRARIHKNIETSTLVDVVKAPKKKKSHG